MRILIRFELTRILITEIIENIVSIRHLIGSNNINFKAANNLQSSFLLCTSVVANKEYIIADTDCKSFFSILIYYFYCYLRSDLFINCILFIKISKPNALIKKNLISFKTSNQANFNLPAKIELS